MYRALLLLAALLLLGVHAKPEGNYHVESTYHQSSSSYKNNELQHQNQDDSFYSEQGDLERRTKPKVNSYAQHSEYVNPRLRQNGEYGQGIDSGFASSNYGNGYGQSNYDSQYGSSRGSSSSSQYSYGGSYHAGGRASYGVASNLEELTQRLQADLSRQLQSAISQQYAQSSAYSHSSSSSSAQMQSDIRRFEDELRANLTRKLQEALSEQYGQQTIRGPYSYSITRGTPSHTANYNTEELDTLKRQLENNLVNQIQQEVRTRYEARESHSYGSSNHDVSSRPTEYTHYSRPAPLSAGSQVYGSNSNAGVKTVHRPTVYYPSSYPDQTGASSSYSQTSNGYASSSTVVYSITDLVTEVQNELDTVVNDILDEEQTKNTELIQRGVRPNYDESFQYLRQSLIRNISDRIDEKIRRYYGRQVERDNRFYSLTPSGTAKSQPNYSREDLENLKQQIEDNLVEKLSYGIRQQESRYDEERTYSQTHQTRPQHTTYGNGYANSHSSSSSFSASSQYGTNYRPSSGVKSVVPLRPAPQTDDYGNSYRQPGYEINPNSEVELTDIRQQLQNDLSRQLQYAIREQTKEYSSYASSGSVGSSNYQTALQQLTDELKRNLTEQLQRSLRQHYGDQRSRGSYSYSQTASGSLHTSANYNQQQLEDLTRQLQENLIRQLQDSFQRSWSSAYSYSSSSGSSDYTRPSYGFKSGGVKGHSQSYTYGSQVAAEDCDESGYVSHQPYRRKRSAVHDYQQQYADDLTQQQEDVFDYYRNYGQQQQPQPVRYQDLTQQQEDGFDYYRSHPRQQQQQHLEDLTQQQDVFDNYGNYGQQQQPQPVRLQDLTQQDEDDYYSTHYQPRQQQHNGDLTQQQEDMFDYPGNYGQQQQPQPVRFQQQQQQTGALTQHHEDDYYTQQQQQPNFGQLNNQKQTETFSLNNAPGFGAVHQQKPSEKLQSPYSQQSQVDDLTQQIDDLTQQQEPEDIYGNLQIGSQQKQDQKDLTQQQLQDGFELVNQGSIGNPRRYQNSQIRPISTTETYQQQDNDQLTQQLEDGFEILQQQQNEDDLAKLEVGNSQYNYQTPIQRYLSSTTAKYTHENSQLTQQLDEEYENLQQNEDNFEKLETGSSQYQKPSITFPSSTTEKYNQKQVDGLTQQQDEKPNPVIPLSFPSAQINAQNDLTQQVEDGFADLEIASQKQQQQQNLNLQQIEQDRDLTQQSEESFGQNYSQQSTGNLQSDSYRKPKDQVQLTQQSEDDFAGQYQTQSQQQNRGDLQSGSYSKPYDQELTQQTEDDFGPLSFGSQVNQQSGTYPKPNVDDGLTQQTEDGFGGLTFGSQGRGKDSSDILPAGSQTKPSYDQQEQQQQQVPYSDEDLTQQTEYEPIGRQDGSPSYYPPGYQGPRRLYLSSSHSHYRNDDQVQHAVQHSVEQPEEVHPIPKQIEKQRAYQVQNVDQQELVSKTPPERDTEQVEDLVQKPIDEQNLYQEQQATVNEVPPGQQFDESLVQHEQLTEPPPAPGFWKRFGNKVSNAYGSVRDKAREVFG